MEGGDFLMSSVDNRIVKMVFDNEKFQEGVQKTMDTLDKLKEKLTFKNYDKSFKGVEASLNGMNFSGVESGVESLQKRFSTMGIVGMEVTRRITNAAIDAGKKISNATIGQIKQGGMTRALNIEQARFQLKGLGLDVEEITQNALDAVKGTAYGLDEAAKAASVLGASGVKAGKDMRNTLTSIAGAAAMTGRGFGDIADIYSTVASNGKLMTEQLRQFSHSGLNVTAVLQEAYGKTGAEIQQMVKDGEISFKEFSNAMQKFGKHAQSANDTYTGSLANMKAALSRLGAIFATTFDEEESLGYIENMKFLFNAITPLIDQVTSALGPFAKQVRTIMTSFQKSFVKIIETLTGNTDKVTGPIVDLVHGLTNIINALGSAIKPIGKAFKDVFSNATMSNFVKAISRFKEFTATLKLNARQAKNMEYFYKAIFSIFKLIGTVVKSVIDGISRVFKPLGGLLNVLNFIVGVVSRLVYWFVTAVTKIRLVSRVFTAVTYAIQGVLTVIAALVKGIIWVVNAIAHSKPVVAVVSTISTAFKFCADHISKFIEKLKEMARKVASFVGEAAFKAIKKFTEILFNGFKKGAEYASKLVSRFKELLGTIKDSRAFKKFEETLGKIRDHLSKAAGKVKEFAKAVKDWVAEHHLVQTFISILSNGLQLIIGIAILVAGKIKDLALRFKDFLEQHGLIEKFTDVFHKGFEKVRDVLKEVVEHIKDFGEYLANKLSDPMKNAGDTAGEVGDKMKSAFDFIFIKNGIKVFSGALKTTKTFGEKLIGVLKLAGRWIVNTADKYNLFDKLKDGITTAFKKIADIPKKVNLQKIADYFPYEAFGVFLLALSSFVRNIGKVGKGVKDTLGSIGEYFDALSERVKGNKWERRAKTLIMFAGAIYILAKAIQTLGQMDLKELGQGAGAVAASMILLVGAMVILGKVLDKCESVNMAQVGLGMLLISSSMFVMAKAVQAFANLDTKAMWLGMVRLGAALLLLTAAVKGGLGSAKNMASTGAGLLLLAGALLMLSVVIKLYSKFDWDTYRKGLLLVAGGLAVLAGAVRLMGQPTGIIKAAIGINLMVVALLGLAAVIKLMGLLKPEEITKGLKVIVLGLGAITLSLLVLQNANPKGTAAAIIMVSAALALIALSIKALGSIDYENLKVGFIGLTAILVAMTAALYILAGNDGIMQAAGCLVAVAAGLALLSLAIGQMASMPLEGLQTSLIGLTALLAVMAIALYELAQVKTASLIAAAGAMLIMAAAMGVLTMAISGLAKIPTDKLVKGIIAMAAALLIMVVAGHAAQGAAIGLLALSAAFIAFGVAANLVAKGIAIVIEAFADGASKIAPLVEAIGDAISKVVDSIAGGISKVLDSIAGIFDSMGNAAKHAGEGVKLIADGIAKLTHLKLGDMVATLAKVADALGDFSKQGSEMASIGEGVSKMAKGFQSVATFGNLTATAFVILSGAFNVLRPAIDGIPQALTITSAAFSSFSSSLLTFGVGIGAAISSVIVEFQKLGASVGQLSSSMLALTGVGTIVSTVMSIVNTTTNLAKAAVDRLKASAASVSKALVVIGLNASVASVGLTGMAVAGAAAMNRFKSSITSGGNKVRSAMASAMASMIASTRATLSNLGKVGSSAMSSLASGIQSGASKVKTAGKTAGNNAKAGFESVKFESAGTAACQGFLNGLNNSSYAQKITSRGTALGNMAYNAAKKALESKSPSKKFRQLGIWANQGFIIGLGMLQDKVYDSSYAIGDNAANALTESVSQIYDMLDADLDANPTITPVLDLSNVQNGINTMNGMIDTRTMSARLSTNMSGVGMVPAFAGAAGDNVTNNNTNTFNITVDGAESPEAFADRLVEAIHMRQRMS